MSTLSDDTASSRASYHDSEEKEELLHPSHFYQLDDAKKSSTRRTLFIGVLLFCAINLGIFIGAAGHSYLTRPVDSRSCAEKTSQYSPILKDVEMTYEVQAFNGSLLKPTVFRQDAGPEVDAAWESIGVDYRPLIVPYEEGIKAGLAADQVKVSAQYGGGFLANVEGLHQLHCLNVLRQALYWNYDHYKQQGTGMFENSDKIVKFHTTHCLDIIRQQLMCTVDTGLLGQVWIDPKEPEAYVDFNTKHKCKNFDAVREWAKVRQAPVDIAGNFLEPPRVGDKVYAEIP